MTAELAFLIGRRVYLRTPLQQDLGPRYLSWMNDPEINAFSRRRLRPSTEDDVTLLRSGPNALHLAVCLRADDRHVGNLSLDPINWADRFAELSILIGDKSVWGTGVATEAIHLVARHAFRTLGLHRLQAGTFNPAFERAVKKLGWREEGRLRERARLPDRYVDVVELGLLEGEFRDHPEFDAA